MKKISFLISIIAMIFMACEKDPGVTPQVNGNPLDSIPSDSIITVNIYNDDTVINYSFLAKPTIINITHYAEEGDVSYLENLYREETSEYVVVICVDKIPKDFVIDAIPTPRYSDEYLLMTYEGWQDYDHSIFKNYMYAFFRSNDNVFGLFDFGIIDPSLYKLDIYFTDGVHYTITKDTDNIFLRTNGQFAFAFFPTDNSYLEQLENVTIDKLVFSGEIVTYNVQFNKAKSEFYKNIVKAILE